jgi:predicted ATPase
LGKQLVKLAQQAQEPALLLEAHHELWANLTELGELTSARTHLEQGFVLYDSEKHRHHAFLYGGHDPGVCCRYHAAAVLWLLGYPDQALRRSRESMSLARELSHPSTMAVASYFIAWFHQHLGEVQAVQQRVEEILTLSTEHGFQRWRLQLAFLQGWLLYGQGEREAGQAQMAKALATDIATGMPGRWRVHSAALLADTYRITGRTVEGLSVVTDALTRAQQTGCSYYNAELYRIKGELLLGQATANQEQSEACFQNGLKVARSQSAKSLELRVAMSLSRLWQRQGKTAEARQLLGDIYGWFTEGFDTADLQEAQTLLKELS